VVHIVSMAEIGALVGDPARANMLEALFDRRALTAKELAVRAGVSPQTASGHLSKLIATGLIAMERHGRFRYHRLASREIAGMLESMMQVASTQNITKAGRTVRTGPRDAAMRIARSCYDHMAGQLAVGLTDAMVDRGHIEFDNDAAGVTKEGRVFLHQFGIDIAAATQSKRIFCRPCLDWSERRPHLAGAIGAALMQRSFDLGWVKRMNGTRALTITRAGQTGFHKTFGLAPLG
jgi:DNA-binding transcriptional ArsR family regulator